MACTDDRAVGKGLYGVEGVIALKKKCLFRIQVSAGHLNQNKTQQPLWVAENVPGGRKRPCFKFFGICAFQPLGSLDEYL